MEKNHLKNGKIIFPNNLKIKKNIRVGIVGSGKIALEYIKVIKSFNHQLKYLLSFSKNNNAVKIAKKNKIKLLSNYDQLDKIYDVDIWIICCEWKKLKDVLLKFKKFKTPILIEKGIDIDQNFLNFFLKSEKNFFISNISIAYNRNYYDYIYLLYKTIKINHLLYGRFSIYDPYKKLKTKNKIPNYHLPYFITSHWISFIVKLFQNSGIKIIKKKIIKQKNFVQLNLLIKVKNRVVLFDIFNYPNLPDNHNLTLIFKDKIIKISPIETMKILKKMKIVKKGIKNYYIPNQEIFVSDQKFKEGLRHMYYDFINHQIFKKRSLLNTNLKDLLEIYKICNYLS